MSLSRVLLADLVGTCAAISIVAFKNECDEAMHVSWLAPGGNSIQQGLVEPSASLSQRSHFGHRFSVSRASKTGVAEVILEIKGSAEWVCSVDQVGSLICNESMVPSTEAERADFRVKGLQLISPEDTTKARYHLQRSGCDQVLGSWKDDLMFLRNMSFQLVNGDVAQIKGFFAPSVAELLRDDFNRLRTGNYLQIVDPPLSPTLNETALDLRAYLDATEPSQRCKVISNVPFAYRHHDWVGEIHWRAKVLNDVMMCMYSNDWVKAMNFLLTGSGLRVLTAHEKRDVLDIPRLRTGSVMFREFMTGDYSLKHSDAIVHGEEFRSLSINAWFSTVGWKTEWGGCFYWCGHNFSDAFRLSPDFNSAALFIPHGDSNHFVDFVDAPADSLIHGTNHRYSITSFLLLAGDARRHWNAFGSKQKVYVSMETHGVAEAVADEL